ncbi:Os11g0620150, partial [Oryza sativa Japonica Group]
MSINQPITQSIDRDRSIPHLLLRLRSRVRDQIIIRVWPQGEEGIKNPTPPKPKKKRNEKQKRRRRKKEKRR